MKLTLRGLVKLCFSVWVISIIAFVILVLINNQNTGVYSPEMGNAVIGTILTGVFSFGLGLLFIIVDYLFVGKNKHEKDKHIKQTESKPTRALSLNNGLIFIILILFVAAAYLFGTNNNFTLNTSKIKPTAVPVILPSATSTPTNNDSNTQQTVQQTTKVTNPDSPIHCSIHASCGGGTTPLTKRECDNSTCCQIGDKWIFYKDKNQCTNDQNKYNGQNYNYKAPTYAPWPTMKPYPTLYIPAYPTSVPYPTTPPYPEAECNAIKNEWNGFKSNFMANNYNNYSSSAEAIFALEGYRQQYQNAYNATGCIGTLSLY